MEIKVLCDCGQKFKFDVEPVDGKMPWEVNCPVCGLSGTEKANAIIAQQLSAAPPPPPPPSEPVPPAAPYKARLTISRPAAAPASIEPPPIATAVPRPVARAVGTGARPAKRAAAEAADDDPKFWLSVAAVLIGAVLGVTLWHLGYRMTGWSLGFMALVTGCAAGAAPQVLGHYRGVWMGLIAAFVAFVAIFTAQFLNAKVEVTEFVEESSAEEYQDALTEAKAVLAAAPEGTERELRMYLAKEYSFETITVKPGEIEPEDVKDLQRRLPLMRELAAGTLSQEQYHKREREERETAEFEDALTEARAIVAAAPNGTEQELRVYLAKEYSDATYKVTPAEMDPEVVAELQQQLPRMQELASGQLTREKYFQRQHESGETMDDGGFLKFYLIFRTLNIFNIINIVLGIGAAFLTAKG